MTDNEIIKGLASCIRNDACIYEECPIYGTEYCINPMKVYERVVDIINRQKAEIEKLQGKVDMYEEERKYHFEMSRQRIAEAIKEFAERVQKHCTSIELNEYINSLVKEMTGGSE